MAFTIEKSRGTSQSLDEWNHNNADALYKRPCRECKRVDEHEGTVVDVRGVTIEQSNQWTAENVSKARQEESNIGRLLKFKKNNIQRSG